MMFSQNSTVAIDNVLLIKNFVNFYIKVNSGNPQFLFILFLFYQHFSSSNP